ncbi:MAG: hypothetical protein JST20_05965 [Bacteroidetes bacterium]|nr:hypothetical protein [Bacteroidota bacterium]
MTNPKFFYRIRTLIRICLNLNLKSAIGILLFFFINYNGIVKAQVTGAPLPGRPFDEDTTIIFTSPRPLLSEFQQSKVHSKAWGLDLLFSSNGFGAGGFYQRFFSETTSGFINLGISGARNSDEFEQYNPYTGQVYVPNKINRLYIFPLTIGVQYRVFADKIAESLRPHINAGIGTTFILATPYDREFFSAFGHANGYTRFGGFVGVGANLGSSSKSLMGINVRYYFIPFGGNGLESIRDLPITDFGGLFLTLSVGLIN